MDRVPFSVHNLLPEGENGTLKPVQKGMGHPDSMAEHNNMWLPSRWRLTLVWWRQQHSAVSPLTPHSFLSSPSCNILLFLLPYLSRIERAKKEKRGKHPEDGRGEEKENKGEKHLSEAVGRAGYLSLSLPPLAGSLARSLPAPFSSS